MIYALIQIKIVLMSTSGRFFVVVVVVAFHSLDTEVISGLNFDIKKKGNEKGLKQFVNKLN